MAPLRNLIGLDTHCVLRAEIIFAGNMIFYGQRFEQEKLCSQFPLQYITETLSEMKEVVPNIYRMYVSYVLAHPESSGPPNLFFSWLQG